MAKRFEKRHDHITRDIRIFLKKTLNFPSTFLKVHIFQVEEDVILNLKWMI